MRLPAAKIQFRQIAVKMFFLAALIDTLHAAFEDAINRIRVHIAANIFVTIVVHRLMARKLAAN
jgi:hypothetical protein